MLEYYVLDDYEFEALCALGDFAKHAFAGYGKPEEGEVGIAFAFLFYNYMDLLKESAVNVDSSHLIIKKED